MSENAGGARSTLERTLPRDYYFSDEVFEREGARIFHREWFCVGREEELPGAGDYLVLDVAGESVLLVRTREGQLRAHYNVCRHRGCQLVLDGRDKTSCGEAVGPSGTFSGAIRCPYHSWTYTLDGALRAAPFLDEGAGLYREEFTLYPVEVECWGGFIFVNLSPALAAADGRTLRAQLGVVPERLQRYPLAELRTARRIVYH